MPRPQHRPTPVELQSLSMTSRRVGAGLPVAVVCLLLVSATCATASTTQEGAVDFEQQRRENNTSTTDRTDTTQKGAQGFEQYRQKNNNPAIDRPDKIQKGARGFEQDRQENNTPTTDRPDNGPKGVRRFEQDRQENNTPTTDRPDNAQKGAPDFEQHRQEIHTSTTDRTDNTQESAQGFEQHSPDKTSSPPEGSGGGADDPLLFRHALHGLKTRLLANYSADFPPYRSSAEPLPLQLEFRVVSVLDLDSATQVLSIMVYLQVDWVDPDLSWRPEELGSADVHTINFNSDDIWTPAFFLPNMADSNQVVGDYSTVSVTSPGGQCSAHRPMRLYTTCELDVTHYPFDTQRCQIMFIAMQGDRVNMTARVIPDTLQRLFNGSGEWELMQTYVQPRDPLQGAFAAEEDLVEVRLVLRRRYIFYLLTIIFPMALLAVTGSCGFLLPLQCGEKVSFQIAIMISISVFLTFINDAMPKTSTSVSRLAIYVDVLLLQSCLSLLATLTVLRGHHHREGLQRQEAEERLTSRAPEAQTLERQSLETPRQDAAGRWRSRARRLLACLRGTARRSYCCFCCCLPPGALDSAFFLSFVTMAFMGPLAIFVAPPLPWEIDVPEEVY